MPLLNRDLTNFGHNYAVIIGINDYSTRVGPLSTPIKDAEKFKEVLTRVQGFPDDSEHLFYKPNAKKSDFVQLWEWIRSRPLTPPGHPLHVNDSFVFYYAGHGRAGDMTEITGGEEREERPPAGYLLPKDTNFDEPRLSRNPTLVKMEDLIAALNDLGCHHTLVILDCCFSGAFRRADQKRSGGLVLRPLTEARFNRYIEKKAWQVLTSAGPTEAAADRVEIRGDHAKNRTERLRDDHSPFAIALFDAIGGIRQRRGKFVKPLGENLGDGVLTMGEIFNYVHNEVESITRAEVLFDPQNPTLFPFGSDEGGQFIFLDPRHRANSVDWANLKKRNPYLGLNQFDVDDHPFYFGREQDVEKILEVFQAEDGASVPPMLIVSGASGVGKSSFVKAGILSQFRSEYELFQWRPGDKPWELRKYFPGQEPGESWRTTLSLGASLFDLPSDKQPSLLGEESPLNVQEPQILLIDQYEELFTSCTDSERSALESALIELVEEAVKPDSRLKVFLTIRSDFEWQLEVSGFGQEYWAERNVYYHFCRLHSLGLDQLRDALVNPALVLAFDFQKTENQDLIDIILEDLDYLPSALPLLSYTMHQMAKKIIDVEMEDREFKLEVYQNTMGGVSGAMQRRLKEIYNDLSQEEQLLMKQMILRMVDQRDGEYARRRLTKSTKHFELQFAEDLINRAAVDDLIQKLVDADLLAVGKLLGETTYVELVHDSLINSGSLCKTWIQEFGKENLLLQRQIWQAVLEYETEGKEEDFLWHDNPKIVQLKAILDGDANWLNAKESAFVAESWAKRQDELERVKRQRDEAWATAVAARGQQLSFTDLTQGIRVAEGAYNWTSPPVLAAKQALVRTFNAVQEKGVYLHAFYGHTEMIWDAAFFNHTARVATAGQDGFIHVWSRELGQKLFTLQREGVEPFLVSINAMTVSADDEWVLAGSPDGKVYIWDVATRSIKQVLYHFLFGSTVYAIAISSNKRYVAYGGPNGRVLLWELNDGTFNFRELIPGFAGMEFVRALCFCENDTRLMAGGQSGQLISWTLADAAEMEGAPSTIKWQLTTAVKIQSLDVDPNDQFIAIAGINGKAQLLEIETGGLIRVYEGHTGDIYSIAFSADGQQLLTGSWDTHAILWDRESGDPVYTFQVPNSSVNVARLSPDGQYVLTGSHDEIARLWLANKPETLVRDFDHSLLDLSISAHDQFLMTTERKRIGQERRKEVKMWSLHDQRLHGNPIERSIGAFLHHTNHYLTLDDEGEVRIRNLEDHGNTGVYSFEPANCLAISPDDQSIIIGQDDGQIKMRRLESTATAMERFVGHSRKINALAFSGDGQSFISGSSDGMAKVWTLNPKGAMDLLEPGASRTHADLIETVLISPDNQVAITGSRDRKIKIWELSSGKHLHTIDAKAQISALALSPTHNILASSSWNHAVHLWDLDTFELIGAYPGHDTFITSLLFSRSGKACYSASSDGTLRSWLSPSGIKEKLENSQLYQLNLRERTRYGLEQDFD